MRYVTLYITDEIISQLIFLAYVYKLSQTIDFIEVAQQNCRMQVPQETQVRDQLLRLLA